MKNEVFKSGHGNILQQLWGFGERLQIKWKHLKKCFCGAKIIQASVQIIKWYVVYILNVSKA